jgi:hypothetical protein
MSRCALTFAFRTALEAMDSIKETAELCLTNLRCFNKPQLQLDSLSSEKLFPLS